ncbi:MAG TPA: VOC family protein [Alphaproteobacteria bacterium]|nr:VOC family protein [Alphaproteobacteria bacterium]
MIDHVGIKVSDYARSRAFYQAALGVLGIQLLSEFEYEGKHYAGFGSDRATFWIDDNVDTRIGAAHVAFAAPSRAAIHSFHTVALASGGRDNGPPGLRPHYSADYYAAFVLDPDGHNIEAVRVGPAEDKA